MYVLLKTKTINVYHSSEILIIKKKIATYPV